MEKVVDRHETMKAWLIEPAAAPSDSWWQGRKIWARVVVVAPTPAQARMLAERWVLEQEGEPTPQVGNESPTPRPGLDDEKLYHVRPALEEVVDDKARPGVVIAEPLAESSRAASSGMPSIAPDRRAH